jgi:hypothetical protein
VAIRDPATKERVMKLHIAAIMVLLSIFTLHSVVWAQETTAAETVDQLRAQLTEVKAKEESLRIRAQQLDEDLKPENIERSLAGIGSTRPEDLRAQRRRQLTIEKDGVNAQLKILETSRLRLEAAIANAEARAYHESASPKASPAAQMLVDSAVLSNASVVVPLVLVVILFVGLIVLIVVKRAKVT